MMHDEEAISKATAVAALLGVSQKTSSHRGSGLLTVFGSNPQPHINIDNFIPAPYANQRQDQIQNDISSSCKSLNSHQQKGSADTNSLFGTNSSSDASAFLLHHHHHQQALECNASPSGTGDLGIHNQTSTAINAPGTGFITATAANRTTVQNNISFPGSIRPFQSLFHPTSLKIPPPPASPENYVHAMPSSQNSQSQPQPSQAQASADHNLVHATAVLSMTSIGFGIDSSLSASQGDATEAALRAVHDAMERSSLRLPISSPAHNLLQIKVKLGVPARPDDVSQPMSVDVARLATFLPRVIPVLPIQVTVGGLLLPSESPGAPAICTAVACVTLQSQPTVSSPVLGATSPPLTAAHPQSARREMTSPPTSAAAAAAKAQQESLVKSRGQDATLAVKMAPKITIPSINPLKHLDHLATAAASSPPHPVTSSSTNSLSKEPIVAGAVEPSRNQELVQRSTSMEMLAMISEQIRNKDGLQKQQEQQRALLEAAAAKIGSGLATAALMGKHGTVTMDQVGGEAVTAALLQSHGRLTVPMDTTTTPLNNAGSASESSSSTPIMAEEYVGGGGDTSVDEDARNANNYNYKKLPPGTTTKNNQRLFVKHRYRDYSTERPKPGEDDWGTPGTMEDGKRPIRLVPAAFPTKLHETLQQIEADGYGDIIGWMPHGR
jgi:Conserved hypothetical protein (Lin0512_fam)